LTTTAINGGDLQGALKAAIVGGLMDTADAASQGFNAIRYSSERAAGGTNVAIINDFNKILKPVMVTPVAP
jgi:hypothetical protein